MGDIKTAGYTMDQAHDDVVMFRDGQRKIDYIIVYEKSPDILDSEQLASSRLSDKSITEIHRDTFLRKLENLGLNLEEEIIHVSEKKEICFIKVFAEWKVLCHFAEYLNMRAPIMINASLKDGKKDLFEIFSWISGNNVPNKPVLFYTSTFKIEKIKSFLGSDNQKTFFKQTQRIRVVAEIIKTLIYGNKANFEIGIDRLIKEKCVATAFPPHDGPYKVENKDSDPKLWNKRQILYYYWANWKCFFKSQPTEHIREYFGEKITIYFKWLEFYTTWLIPATLAGLIVFLYGVIIMRKSIIVREVCNTGNSFLMCPLCNEKANCPYWHLSSICFYTHIAYIFDHPLTVIYSVFISIWAISFLEFWKRKSICLAHQWNCMGFENEVEMPRADFIVKATGTEKNPITGAWQPAFPKKISNMRIVVGIVLLLVVVIMVFVFLVGVMIYKIFVTNTLTTIGVSHSLIRFVGNVSGAFLNLIFILIAGKLYTWMAFHLTMWEMHRTQTEFDNHYTIKVFLFQFFNYYASIIYIAFFKGKYTGYPGNYTEIAGMRLDECSSGGCLVELTQQLVVVMVGKQIINNCKEMVIPLLSKYWKRTKIKHSDNIWEQEYQLFEHPGLFEEYLEMVIQFGFVTIFVAAFPLAPAFALLNNLFEIRIDAQKFLCFSRRAIPMRAESIGIWFFILQFLANVAVISNAFIIAFTSDFIPRLVYQYDNNWDLKGYVNFTLAHSPKGALEKDCRYRDLRDKDGFRTLFFWRVLAIRLIFIIVFEHLVFGVIYITKLAIPDIPEDVNLQIKREQYLGKMVLQKDKKENMLKHTAMGSEL